MRAIIFANGVLKNWPDRLKIRPNRDLIIAADGGTFHCRNWKIIPHVVVGDLDSITRDEYAWLKSLDVEVIRHPIRKDQTDLELALRFAGERGAVEVMVLGALGMRWDMTIANVLIMAAPFLKGIDIRLLDGQQEIACLQGRQKCVFHGKPGDMLSLIPISDKATGVTLHGLEYTLNKASIPLGETRGISNVLTKNRATVEIEAGLLLVTITRKK